MSGYEYSRAWFDFAFENPEKISPAHGIIYFFAIEHCNRMGWKEKFGFPAQMVMDAVGIKKHSTYSNYFNDLVNWGFFKLVQKSTNQWSANIISLSCGMPKNGNALSKAIGKHREKHLGSTGISTGYIDKPLNQEPLNQQTNINHDVNEVNVNGSLFQEEKFTEKYSFEEFWDLYDKKVNREKTFKAYMKLSDSVKQQIHTYIPLYKRTRSKQFRKDPYSFIHNKTWLDEIISDSPQQQTTYQTQPPTNFQPPELEEVLQFFRDSAYSAEQGKLAWIYYDNRKWINKKGVLVEDWKEAMVLNWFKPEHRIETMQERRARLDADYYARLGQEAKEAGDE